jgi:hypothetical protein
MRTTPTNPSPKERLAEKTRHMGSAVEMDEPTLVPVTVRGARSPGAIVNSQRSVYSPGRNRRNSLEHYEFNLTDFKQLASAQSK